MSVTFDVGQTPRVTPKTYALGAVMLLMARFGDSF